jgi:hypothetical protein
MRSAFTRFDELGRRCPVCHDQAARCRAALAGGVERALYAELDSLFEVGVVENDLRVLAAHFQLHFLQVDAHCFGDAPPTPTEPVKLMASTAGHGLTSASPITRAAAHHQVEHAGRECRFGR